MMPAILTMSYYRQAWLRWQLEWSRIKKFGIGGIAFRIAKKLSAVVLTVVLLPTALALYLLGYRRVIFFTDRIGHLAIEPDTLLKGQRLGMIKSRKWFVVAPSERVANQHLMSYWEPYFTVYHSPCAVFLMQCVSVWRFIQFDASHFINAETGCQLAYEVNRHWDGRPPILSLTSADEKYAAEAFATLGLPSDAWFVCVHAREGGFSPVDEEIHRHRNGKIDNLVPAIEEITQRGGWVIRLGDPTMVPLKPMSNVIDYAHHSLKSARLDILLCAKAKFILGNTSGIFLVGTVFGIPSVLANMIPLPTLGFNRTDVSIPKLYRNSQGDYLSMVDIMLSEIATYRYASLYEDKQLIIEENTAEEIKEAVQEMFARLDGEFEQSEDDEKMQLAFEQLFKPQHYSYGASAKIATTFMRRHTKLFTTLSTKETI